MPPEVGAPGPPSDPVTEFTVVAQDIEWDLDTVVVPAGTEVVATVENRDDDVPHNLHVTSPGDPRPSWSPAR
ncbi:MAG: hypothetical protein ACRDZ9_06135 [Acidimicrobiales bacterium]